MLDDQRQLDGHLAAGGIETAHFLERDRLLVDVGDERSAELRPVPAEGPEKLIGALGVRRLQGGIRTDSVLPLRVVSIRSSSGRLADSDGHRAYRSPLSGCLAAGEVHRPRSREVRAALVPERRRNRARRRRRSTERISCCPPSRRSRWPSFVNPIYQSSNLPMQVYFTP